MHGETHKRPIKYAADNIYQISCCFRDKIKLDILCCLVISLPDVTSYDKAASMRAMVFVLKYLVTCGLVKGVLTRQIRISEILV